MVKPEHVCHFCGLDECVCDAPVVCPGCHAVGPERCLPGCIDAEIEAENRERDSGCDDWEDPICDCGEPGYACKCDYMEDG